MSGEGMISNCCPVQSAEMARREERGGFNDLIAETIAATRRSAGHGRLSEGEETTIVNALEAMREKVEQGLHVGDGA